MSATVSVVSASPGGILDDVRIVVDRVRAGHGEPDAAAVFVTAAWGLLPAGVGNDWCDQLRDLGHELSLVVPPSPALAAVFHRSARVYVDRDDVRFAEAEGLAELGVWRELNDPDRHAAVLDWLERIYRRRGRWHLAMDCVDERLALFDDQPDRFTAELHHLGALLIEADRPDTAIRYLTRARDAYTTLSDTTPDQVADVTRLLAAARAQVNTASTTGRCAG